MGETKSKPHTKGIGRKGISYPKPKPPKRSKPKSSPPKKKGRSFWSKKDKRVARKIWRKLI